MKSAESKGEKRGVPLLTIRTTKRCCRSQSKLGNPWATAIEIEIDTQVYRKTGKDRERDRGTEIEIDS